jgi:hypothetical protein
MRDAEGDMKRVAIITVLVLFTVTWNAYNQNYSGFTVMKTDKNGTSEPIKSINHAGFVVLDTLKKQMTIATINGEIIIEGHSMKKLSDTRYRFHKYNKENSDFEVEFYKDSVVLYTHLALLHSGFKYKTVFQTDNTSLLSDRK